MEKRPVIQSKADGLRIALVGKTAAPRNSVQNSLYKLHGFKKMRLDDGVVKIARFMYSYKLHKRIKWEKRLEIYDALYKIDPSIHIDYLLRKLMTTTMDVIVADARYLNEIQKLVEAGFILIRVNKTHVGPRQVQLKGIKGAAAGTLKLQEYFGKNYDNYPVSYSIMNDDLYKGREMLARIVEKERAKIREKREQVLSEVRESDGGEEASTRGC